MESRFANSFFSDTKSNNNSNFKNRRVLENRNVDTHQHKRPKLDICLPKANVSLKETSKVEKSLIEDESVWEDFDEEDVLVKADYIERASQAFCKFSEQSGNTKCDIEKSGLLTKPIVDHKASVVSKNPQVAASQRANCQQTPSKLLKKNVLSKASSTGNMKNTHLSASSSSSGISIPNSPFSPCKKIATKPTNTVPESHISTKTPQPSKCNCETSSSQVAKLKDELQTKDGEISLLRSNLEEVRLKSCKGKDELGSLVEKTRLLEKTISDQNTVINFMSGELQSKSQTCERLKSSLKQRSGHTPTTSSSNNKLSSANNDVRFVLVSLFGLKICNTSTKWTSPHQRMSTFTDCGVSSSTQRTEMYFSPAMLTQLANHDGRLLFDICSAHITQSDRPIHFLQNLDGTCQEIQDDRWFISILFEFQKHQSFATDLVANCLDKLINICRSSIEGIGRNRDTTVNQSQRMKELYNKHHEIAPLSKNYELLSPTCWYSEESAVKERRLLHLISKIIDIEPQLAQVVVPKNFRSVNKCNFKLPRSSNTEKSLLHVLRNTLKLIKDECISLNLNGFLASSASLLISIMKSRIEINEEGQKLMNEIFRLILLSCPGPTAMLFACKFLPAVDDKYTFINSDLCRNIPAKEHYESERSNTFDEETCTITVICYLVQAMKNDRQISRITDVLVRWLRILQMKWDKSSYPPWMNWGSLAQLPANHKLLCDCRCQLNKLVLKLLSDAANLFSNESYKMELKDKRGLEMLLDRGIVLIFAAAIGEDRSLSIEPGEIEANYELFVRTLSVCSNLNVSAIQLKKLKHLELQEMKNANETNEDLCTELTRKMCRF